MFTLEVYGMIFFLSVELCGAFSRSRKQKSCSNTFAISHCDFKIENETACSKHMLKTIVATRLKREE